MSNANERIGLGLIGAGLIGSIHALGLKTAIAKMNLPVELAHVADAVPGKAERFRSTFGFRQASEDAAALIADPAVDAVYVCTWTAAHPELVAAVTAAGKHVFCEKPLAFTAADAGQMLAAAQAAGVHHQVGLVLRQGPLWNVLRHELMTRELGFPITLIFRDDQCFPIKGAHPSSWRSDPAKAGAGTLIEHSIHDLDLLEWMLGPITSLHARTASRFGKPGIEDLAKVELDFASGMTGTLASVWHDVENRHSNRRLEIFHEKVFLAVEDEFTGPITVMEGAGKQTEIPAAEVNRRFWDLRGIEDPAERDLTTHFGFYEDYLFLQRLLTGQPQPVPDFTVAVRAHRLVDACYESARTGTMIRTL
jgi:predicted dehydrogenase